MTVQIGHRLVTWEDELKPNTCGSRMLHFAQKSHFDDAELYNIAVSTLEGARVRMLAARLYVAEKQLGVMRWQTEQLLRQQEDLARAIPDWNVIEGEQH